MHSAPAAPVLVHSVAPGEGHVMVPQSPAGQLTVHAHEDEQLTSWHALLSVQLTVHAPVEQVTFWHAPGTLQLKVHGTVEPHLRSPHAFIVEQVTAHDRLLELHMVPLHALALEHWIVQA
jgi:hypothetical protein